MQKVYSRINWENDPSTNTPINEDNLNKMDYAIGEIDSRVVSLYGYQERVAESEKNSKQSEVKAKVSEGNALESELKAKEYMESAFSGTPEGYADLVEKVGLLDIAKSTDFTLYKSFAGAYRLKGLKGNTVQYVDILKYSGGAVSLDSSNSSFTYTLPTPLTIDPTAKYKIALVDMNGGDYDIFNTYASIQITDGQLFVQETLVGNNVTELVIGLSTVTEITVVSKTKRLTFSSIMLIPPVSPAYPQPLNHYGDCVEMIQGYVNTNNGIVMALDTCVSAKNLIPCKPNDNVVVNYSGVSSTIRFAVYDEQGAYINYVDRSNVSKGELTIPSGVYYFRFHIASTEKLTPQTVGKIQLTVNGKYLGCVRGHGKNFVKYLDNNSIGKVGESITGAGITATRNKDGSVTLVGTTTQANVFFNINWLSGTKAFPNGKYISSGSSKNVNVQIVCTNGAISSRDSEFTIDDSKSDNWLRLQINASGTVVNETVYPMVRKADITDDTYEPYKETIAWYYTDEPIRKGDILFKENGLFKVEHGFTNAVCDGSADELVTFNSVVNGFCKCAIDLPNGAIMSNVDDVMSSHFTISPYGNGSIWTNPTEETIIVAISTVKGRIALTIKGINSLEELKTWLAEKKPEFQYKRETPTIEVLDTQSQINLNSIETFDGVTYLEVDSRVKPLGIEGEYGTSQVGALALENANLRDKAKISAFRVKETTVTGTTTSAGTLETGVSKNAHIITATCEGRLCIPFVPVASAGGRPSVAVFEYSLNPVADTNVTVAVSYYED